MKRAFTLIELVVAVAILAMVLSFAGVIFKVSIGAYRTATANTEIMQKLRAITDQLNRDFKGLRKDGEIFVVWVATPAPGSDPTDPAAYERFDRIMFFADGDFQSYGVNPSVVRGNTARICYMLAKKGNLEAEGQNREGRILARTQHILTADDSSGLLPFPDPGAFTPEQWNEWHNRREYDKISLEGWKNIPWLPPGKADMLSVITDIRVDLGVEDDHLIGATVDPVDPASIHMLFCEGVGEFKVQGWYDDQQRWVPKVDPDGDGDWTDDTDFFLADPNRVPGVLYPYPPYGVVILGGVLFEGNLFQELLNEARFDEIPGLGRALKFTFTLYDSKGILEGGRTFTHIVYLGD